MNVLKKILFLAISLFCVTSCFAFSKAIKLGEPYNGAVKDSIFVDDAYGNKYIVVEKGCATWFYENADVSTNERKSSSELHATVFGTEPLTDSSTVYGKWQKDCEQISDSVGRSYPNFTGALIYLGIGGLGGYLTFRSYEGNVTAIVGRAFGISLLASGAFHFVRYIVQGARGDVNKKAQMQRGLADEYGKQKHRWELKINPMIDPQNSGGGLLMQLLF